MNQSDPESLKFDGAELKKMRKAIRPKVTQEDMADILGISRETVSHIENNKAAAIRGLSLETILKWHSYCRSRLPRQNSNEFIEYVKRIFSI